MPTPTPTELEPTLFSLEEQISALESENAKLNARLLDYQDSKTEGKTAPKKEKEKNKQNIQKLKKTNQALQHACTTAQAVSDADSLSHAKEIEALKKSIEDLKATQHTLNLESSPAPITLADSLTSQQITILRAKKKEYLEKQKNLAMQIQDTDAQIQAVQSTQAAQQVHTHKTCLSSLELELKRQESENEHLKTAKRSLLDMTTQLKNYKTAFTAQTSLKHADNRRDLEGLQRIIRTIARI